VLGYSQLYFAEDRWACTGGCGIMILIFNFTWKILPSVGNYYDYSTKANLFGVAGAANIFSNGYTWDLQGN
jgi:hypothetical protein